MASSHAEALLARAQRVLAGGPGTLSKHPSRFPAGLAPLFLAQGDGATVWDVDGREYLDCIGALGPVLLGHAHPGVMAAVRHQVGRMASSSMSTALEVEVAERLVDVIPGAEQVRFASNGADVTNAAVKLARYVTGHQHVIYVGYHGGFSDYLITTDKAGGILPQIQPYNHQVAWRDISAVSHVINLASKRDDLAAIIFEVPPELCGMPREETGATIQAYIDTAHEFGAIAILDEVVTWGRYGNGGAQAYYNVRADLVCLSKALGNGFPISAITGPRDLMRAFDGGQVFLSTTFGASPVSLAACKAVLAALPGEYPALVEHGGRFGYILDALVRECQVPCALRGMHGRFVLDWQGCEAATVAELKTLWMQEMLRRGILVGVVFLPMTAWNSSIVERLLDAASETFEIIAEVVQGKKALSDALHCPVVGEVFERYQRQP